MAEEFHDRWERVSEEGDQFLKFDAIENKRNQRPDLHAWLLLDHLFPNPGRDMVCAAEHDVIWLDVEGEKLETLTDEQIIELSRCGVFHDREHDRLSMFA